MTFVAIRVWLHRERAQAAEARRRADERYEQANRERLQRFASSHCSFVGSGNVIYEFEHSYDLSAEVRKKWPALADSSVKILNGQRGKIAVINPTEWPENGANSELHQLLQYLTMRAGPEQRREVLFCATSVEAMRFEADEREKLRLEIEARVAERSASLADRQASDLGEGAIAVYIISSTNQRSAKVGISKDPQGRLKSLQTGNASILCVSSQYWMRNRDDALLLESETHRELQRRGYKRSGEWFPVHSDVAAVAIAQAYDLLLERGIVDRTPVEVSDSATNAELARSLAASLRWRLSKRSNLTTVLGNRRITIFKGRKGWAWVVDGQFSPGTFKSSDEAQRDCIQRFAPERETMLALMLAHKSPPS